LCIIKYLAHTACHTEVVRPGEFWRSSMKKWRRRVRAAIGMGLTWGAAWFGAGIVLAVASAFDADVPFPLLFGLLGFIAGIIFSGILVATEGRRRFDRMSLPRFAGWGAA